MSAEAASLVRTWSVGRWTVTVTLPQFSADQMGYAVFEWSPAAPTRRLTKSEMRQYRAGRDRAIAELAQAAGATAFVLEVA